MSMPWIPGFILVLIHSGIFGIYKNILERARNDLLKDHKVLKWQAFLGGSVGFCERDALTYHV